MFGKNVGILGENIAFGYLKKKGYKILETNYKNKLGEIDIIAKDGKTVVFVEVKTRSSYDFGRASEAVSKTKQTKLSNVATLYLVANQLMDAPIRFDVIEVYPDNINHIINAF